MGLFTKGKPANVFNFWQNVPEPRFSYHRGKDSAYVFFIDDHEDRDRILAQRLYATDNSKHMFKILLEKEVYDKTPEYYSEKALFAQLDFYKGVSKDVTSQLLIGAIIIGLLSMFVLNFILRLTPMFGSMIALVVSLIYMFTFMNVGFKRILAKRRKLFRQTLISLFGEERLEEMLDIQDEYTKRRNNELKEVRARVEKMDDVEDRPGVDDVAEATKATNEELEKDDKEESK